MHSPAGREHHQLPHALLPPDAGEYAFTLWQAEDSENEVTGAGCSRKFWFEGISDPGRVPLVRFGNRQKIGIGLVTADRMN
jgi:hypothetical protein